MISKFKKSQRVRNRIFPNFWIDGILLLTIIAAVCLSIMLTRTSSDSASTGLNQSGFEVSGIVDNDTVLINKTDTSRICFIGDSRVFDMQQVVITDASFITNKEADLYWLSDSAFARFDDIEQNIDICVVSIGINDLENAIAYIDECNNLANQYPDKIFIFVNVGPVEESLCQSQSNNNIRQFNQQMNEGLCDSWIYVDVYQYLVSKDFNTTNGISYDIQTIADMFVWVCGQIT